MKTESVQVLTASVEGGVGDVQILEERARGGDEQVWEIRGGKEIKRKERKEVRWKGRERKRINRKGKGGRGGKRGCLSSGQVQLTLNCLALELEHLSVPEGPEEWSVDRVPPPSESSFFAALLADFAGSRVTSQKNVRYVEK